jgi:DNA repair protein RadA/Sms
MSSVASKYWKPALILALILSVISSFRDQSFARDLVVFGEVGLAGEIRPVANGQERLREAAKHGFKRAIVPAGNAPKQPIAGMTVIPVRRVSEALESLS